MCFGKKTIHNKLKTEKHKHAYNITVDTEIGENFNIRNIYKTTTLSDTNLEAL